MISTQSLVVPGEQFPCGIFITTLLKQNPEIFDPKKNWLLLKPLIFIQKKVPLLLPELADIKNRTDLQKTPYIDSQLFSLTRNREARRAIKNVTFDQYANARAVAFYYWAQEEIRKKGLRKFLAGLSRKHWALFILLFGGFCYLFWEILFQFIPSLSSWFFRQYDIFLEWLADVWPGFVTDFPIMRGNQWDSEILDTIKMLIQKYSGLEKNFINSSSLSKQFLGMKDENVDLQIQLKQVHTKLLKLFEQMVEKIKNNQDEDGLLTELSTVLLVIIHKFLDKKEFAIKVPFLDYVKKTYQIIIKDKSNYGFIDYYQGLFDLYDVPGRDKYGLDVFREIYQQRVKEITKGIKKWSENN